MGRFRGLFDKFVSEPGPSVVWENIENLPPHSILEYSGLQSTSTNEEIRSMLDRLVVIKLNGALATPVGYRGPTSAIPVRNDLTSLDLTVQHRTSEPYIRNFGTSSVDEFLPHRGRYN